VSGQIRAALGRFDLLRIERVPDSPDVLLSLIAGADATPHLYATHLVDLADTGEAWRARLDPGFVRHLERKGKRLRPRGDRRFRVVTDVSEVDSLMARMQEFRAVRFAEHRGRDLVQDPGCFRFYCRVARESVATGPGSLSVLEIGGEPVAVAFDLIERDRDLFLLVGYDVGRLRNYSLGLLIVDELAQDAIRRGQAHFDLTVGDEPYKADFGARPRPLFEVRVQRTPLGRAEVAGRAAYLRARQLAKQAVRELERRRSNSDRPIDRRSAVPPGTDGRQARPDRPSPTVTSSP
jgi:CelD/BcsL family acetyltransferase involved in cellulose biosynthesis